jgi:hypothetical protein
MALSHQSELPEFFSPQQVKQGNLKIPTNSGLRQAGIIGDFWMRSFVTLL